MTSSLPAVQQMGGLSLVIAPGQPPHMLLVCLAWTPPHKHTSTSILLSPSHFPHLTLGLCLLGFQVFWLGLINMVMVSMLELAIVSCLVSLGSFREGVLVQPDSGPDS